MSYEQRMRIYAALGETSPHIIESYIKCLSHKIPVRKVKWIKDVEHGIIRDMDVYLTDASQVDKRFLQSNASRKGNHREKHSDLEHSTDLSVYQFVKNPKNILYFQIFLDKKNL